MSETEIEPHVVDPASLTDEDLMRDVACFSSAFEHGHEQCKQCHVRDRCVTRMAKVVIPDRIVEMGGPDKRDVDWTLDDLAMMLGSDTKSVQLVMEIGRGRKIREVLGPSAADAEDEPAPPPEPEPPVAEVIELATRKKKKPPPKKKKAKAKASPKADPVDLLAQDQFARDHEREKKRSPLIARLSPGVILSRVYKKEEYEVIVRKGRYEFNGQSYPTLYSIVMEITGGRTYNRQVIRGQQREGTRVMSNWSATRFFKLKER